MKISETIERECCQRQDFKPYKGLVDKTKKGFVVIKTHKPVYGETSPSIGTIGAMLAAVGLKLKIDTEPLISLEREKT